ncbi:MAG: hypothetical protein L0Y74_02490 [candidate division Zixibacteria bacterium]|nr:hypothetical protein [candidate division Zixibacteria bacterium]
MKRFVDYFAYLEEEIRIKKLQYLVNQTCYILSHQLLSEPEARKRMEWLREQALILFPDKMETYDIVYQTRLDRLWKEHYGKLRR